MEILNLLWLWEGSVLPYIILDLFYCMILLGGFLSPSPQTQIFLRRSDFSGKKNHFQQMTADNRAKHFLRQFSFLSHCLPHSWSNANSCNLLCKTTALSAETCYWGVEGAAEILSCPPLPELWGSEGADPEPGAEDLGESKSRQGWAG